MGVMSSDMVNFFIIVVSCWVNIIIFGGIGLGKIILFNVLLMYIFENERVIILEDVVEFNFE